MSQNIVIFDMDGTLVDSSRGITSAINLVRSEYNLGPLEPSTVIDAINGLHSDLPTIFYGTATYEVRHKELFEKFYYDECIKDLFVYDGIHEMLEILKENNISCSVATNAPASFAHRILKHVGIHHHFDYILGACGHKSKPNPEMLNTILSNYRYDKEHNRFSFMIGDSLKDIEAAQNADIRGIHIQWGFSDEIFQNSIKSPKDIIKLLDIN